MNLRRIAVWVGLFLVHGFNTSADTVVTYQVDMSAEVGQGFTPQADTVWVEALEWHGGSREFSWVLKLTNNPAGPNPCLYTGTGVDTNDAPGSLLGYVFYYGRDDWSDLGSTPRTARLPDSNGASLVLPVVYYSMPPGGWPATNTVAITFQVDMSRQATLGWFTLAKDRVYVAAGFDSVDYGYLLTNHAAGPNPHLFTGTISRENYVPGGTLSYRFYYKSNNVTVYEKPFSTMGGNRTAVLPTATNASLVLPVVCFDDLPPGVPLVTNQVTFQVDMSARLAAASSDLDQVLVYCSVSFKGELQLTNAPLPSNTNLYSGSLTVVSMAGVRMGYRFSYGLVSKWGHGYPPGVILQEQPLSTGGANRSFTLLATNGTIVLPFVYFGDLAPADLLPVPTVVHFNVDMAAAVTTDGHPFHPILDRVFVNGDFVWYHCDGCSGTAQPGWWPWDPFVNRANYYLTNIPGTQVYTAAISLGGSRVLTYRYSINGQDNEPTGGKNYVRWIRGTGDYTLPMDKFSAAVQEPSFGELIARGSGPDHILISWLGRPGVRLQSCPVLPTAAWEDHPETDGLSATNWPLSAAQRFFRLVKP